MGAQKIVYIFIKPKGSCLFIYIHIYWLFKKVPFAGSKRNKWRAILKKFISQKTFSKNIYISFYFIQMESIAKVQKEPVKRYQGEWYQRIS